METITVNGELLFELASKQQWINRVPQILPPKIRGGESWIWVDKNGNVFECGADFAAAHKHDTYPCKVYRLSNVAGWAKGMAGAKENTSSVSVPAVRVRFSPPDTEETFEGTVIEESAHSYLVIPDDNLTGTARWNKKVCELLS